MADEHSGFNRRDRCLLRLNKWHAESVDSACAPTRFIVNPRAPIEGRRSAPAAFSRPSHPRPASSHPARPQTTPHPSAAQAELRPKSHQKQQTAPFSRRYVILSTRSGATGSDVLIRPVPMSANTGLRRTADLWHPAWRQAAIKLRLDSMIDTFKLKFGRAPGLDPAVVKATPVTVFVGPNNSGKSKVLAELSRYCQQGTLAANDVILGRVEFSGPPAATIEGLVGSAISVAAASAQKIRRGHLLTRQHQVSESDFRAALQDPNSNPARFCQWFLGGLTLMLDGKSRINLVSEQAGGDLQGNPTTSFQTLFQQDDKRSEVRRIIHEAFESYLVIDPTKMGRLRARLSEVAPPDDRTERGWHKEAVEFHSKAMMIDSASDGVKAFTGMIAEIVAGDPAIVLIDEPEAFLHPTLSVKLGKEIASAATKADKRVFVSTHSPNFVMGCIHSGASVNIIRLTYRRGVPTARVLRNDDLLSLMRNPLLRSTGVLSALFYEFVVVTESDADRAFYQEINERLLKSGSNMGIANCLFLNAQNKQTVQTILQPLRHLGIPAVGIVDLDVLKDGGKTWTDFLDGGCIPALEHQSLGTLRASLKDRMTATGKNMKRDGGIDILVGQERESAANLLEKLAEYGLFVVPGGELESWLISLGATGHGPQWLIDIFERMGEDPDDPAYVKPTNIDVWHFLGLVRKWLYEPKRKGIPV